MLRGILENSRRILIPRLDTHGDIILLQGFLNALLTKYPRIEITLLVREGYDQLKPLFPDRIKWMTTQANGYSPPEGQNVEETDLLLNQLKKEEWDVVLTTTYDRTWLNHTISAALKEARRIAIGEAEEIEPRIQDLWKQRNILVESPYDEFVPVDEYSHETEKYQVLWEALTGNQEKLSAPVLEVPKEIELRAEEILSTLGMDHKEYCICAPAGTDNVQIKAWSQEKYAEILCWLEEKQGLGILVIGSEREKERLEQVVSLTQQKGCSPSLWIGKDGELPLAAALIKKAKLYLGNDTGLMHIGSAVGIPVIAIFGGGHWPRFLPRGNSVVLVKELPCFGCNWRCIFGDAPCTKLISFKDVKKAFSLLSQAGDESFRMIRQAEASPDSIVEELVRSLNQHIEYCLQIADDRDLAVQEIHRRDQWIAELRNDRDTAVQEIHKRDDLIVELKNDRDTAVQEIHKRDDLIVELRSARDTAVQEIHRRDQSIAELRNDRDTAVQEIHARDARIVRLQEIKEETLRMIPLVSIVTPVFNAEKWIENCIKSVIIQNYPRIEHIIVDGGSTDRTLDICRNYPHLVIHSQKDRGQSHAINKGFAMAQGDILAWLCADDEYEPGAVRIAVKSIQSGHEVVMGCSRFIDAEGNLIAEHPANAHPYYDHGMFLRFWRYNPISQPATFWTRKMWEACGPLRENLYFAMDYDLWLRMSQRARFERMEAHVAKYRIHPEAKCFADNYGSRVELIQVSRRYWPSRWNPGRWFLYLQYMATWSPITKHYSDAERSLNAALQHLGKKKRFSAITSFILAHLKHIATPFMPGYSVALQRILVEGIRPRWLWRFIKRIYDTLRMEKKVTLRLTNENPQNEDTIILEAEWKGYKDPQFRFWGKRGSEFILLRDWGPEKSYGPVLRAKGIRDYGVHLRSGDQGDFIDQAWTKDLLG